MAKHTLGLFYSRDDTQNLSEVGTVYMNTHGMSLLLLTQCHKWHFEAADAGNLESMGK